LLSRPLATDELKKIAYMLRELTLAEGRDGKLRLGPAEALPMGGLAFGSGLAFGGLPPGFAIYGPALDITLSGECFSPGAKIIEVFPRPLLGCAVLNAGEDCPAGAPPPPDISFRAAAVANMAYRPLSAGEHSGESGYSFSWKIGELHWLPAHRQPVRRGVP
jgi:hypothetical protein